MITFASIVISNSVRSFDREYTYIIPKKYIDVAFKGCRVIVPFGAGNKSIEGFIIHIEEHEKIDLGYKLKEIKEILPNSPAINQDLLKLVIWMKKRYICTYYEAIKCMIPPGSTINTIKYIRLNKQQHSGVTAENIGNKLGNKDDFTNNQGIKKMTITQNKILQCLVSENGIIEYEELIALIKSKNIKKNLEELENHDYISITEEYITKAKEKYAKFVYLNKDKDEVIADIDNDKFNNMNYIRILELLIENDQVLQSDLLRHVGVSLSTVKTLVKRGYICVEKREVIRDPFSEDDFIKTEPLKLNDEQDEIVNSIKLDLEEGRFVESLLYGVTGSGKTEVYLQLIQFVIDNGKSAIVLVPEISLTPQMVKRFKSRFENRVAVLHSGLSLGERFDQWKQIKNGELDIVVGARSAIFAPLNNIGIIIIDEEHDSSYKSDYIIRYNAREVARMRAKINNAYLILGSATPCMEDFYRAKTGKIKLYRLTKRANDQDLPEIRIVDMKNELENGNRSIFSKELADEINNNLLRGEQTILFVHRRGYASFILCRSCGEKIKCKYCNITLTYHLNDNRLICHYCGYTEKKSDVCQCGSKKIKQLGIGTQRVIEEIKNKFPDASVIRMDSDVTGYKNSHKEILDEFINSKIDILVGTQMITKGHDFPNVTLIGVLLADGLLGTADFRAPERTYQILTQVSGRAGRAELRGRSIIQAYDVENYSILASQIQDFENFYEQEIKLRKILNYPPFCGIVMVTMAGFDDILVKEIICYVKKIVTDKIIAGSGISIIGPARSTVSKIKDKYRWRLIIKYDDLNFIVVILTMINDWYYNEYKKSNVKLIIDINPQNLL